MKKLLLFCAESTPSVSNASYYAEIVHKSAMSRKIKAQLMSILPDLTSENILEKSENLIENISSTIMPIQAKKMKSFVIENIFLIRSMLRFVIFYLLF